MMRYLSIMVLLGLLVSVAPQSYAESNALEQLQQMAGGKEHTGVKFDGSPNSQHRSGVDTTVNYKYSEPVTPVGVDKSSYTIQNSTYSVQNSSGNYSVQNSSQTAPASK